MVRVHSLIHFNFLVTPMHFKKITNHLELFNKYLFYKKLIQIYLIKNLCYMSKT